MDWTPVADIQPGSGKGFRPSNRAGLNMPPECAFLKDSPFILWDLGSDLWCPRVPIAASSPLATCYGVGTHPIKDVCLRLCQIYTNSPGLTRMKETYLRWFKWIQIQPQLPDRITLRDPLLYQDDASA